MVEVLDTDHTDDSGEWPLRRLNTDLELVLILVLILEAKEVKAYSLLGTLRETCLKAACK